MMPIPSHLKEIAKPVDQVLDEAPLRASLQCKCGSISFQLLYPGQTRAIGDQVIPVTANVGGNYFFIVQTLCRQCSYEVTLLDADFHGWNGFVCHDPAQASVLRPPLVPWQCVACDSREYEAEIFIQGEGEADYIVETGNENGDQWPNAFGYFALSAICSKCRLNTPDLFTCETM